MSLRQIKASKKLFKSGTHRLITPDETLKKVSPFMAEMGITRIANITGLDYINIPVVTVCRPNSRAVAVSQGKGLDLQAAKASGLMEATETFHAEHIDLPLKLSSVQELGTHHAVIDTNKLPRLSISQFHENQPILWIEGIDLISHCPRWVPFDMVHSNYTIPLPTGSGSFIMSTNGLASGNHYLEAVIHGICEIIERDANTLFHIDSLYDAQMRNSEISSRNRLLDLTTVNDPCCSKILNKFIKAQIEVKVWETTSDTDIPSFFCEITPLQADQSRPAYGSGCHLTRSLALLRAMAEAAQSRLTLISGSRDDISVNVYSGKTNIRMVKNNMDRPSRDFTSIPSWDHDFLQEDLSVLVNQLANIGIKEIAVVDLTKEKFNIPVVRVIIPGLESMHDIPGYKIGNRGLNKINEIEQREKLPQ